jgi:ABC-type arginine transport system ATPase subunit
MSDEIDKQLRELQACFKSDIRTGKDQILESLPVSQIKVIESVTKEKTSDFMKKFSKKAKMDLCEEGGLLYQQWKKWGDLNNKDAIQSFGNILLGMGIGAGNVQILIVAIVVIVVHIGIRVICEDYPDNEVSQ